MIMQIIYFKWQLFLMWCCLGTGPVPDQGTLVVNMTNIEDAKGVLRFGLYNNQDGFLKENGEYRWTFINVLSTEEIRLELENVPFGDYSIAVYHDLNSNEELDRGIFGIPKEPFAFSGGYDSKWRIPSFEKTKFRFAHSTLKMELRLMKWWDL